MVFHQFAGFCPPSHYKPILHILPLAPSSRCFTSRHSAFGLPSETYLWSSSKHKLIIRGKQALILRNECSYKCIICTVRPSTHGHTQLRPCGTVALTYLLAWCCIFVSGLKRYSVVIALPCNLATCKRTKYADESMQLRLACVEGLTLKM